MLFQLFYQTFKSFLSTSVISQNDTQQLIEYLSIDVDYHSKDYAMQCFEDIRENFWDDIKCLQFTF